VPRAALQRADRSLILTLQDKDGQIGLYDDWDDDGVTYQMDFETGWSDLQMNELKILKRMTALLFTQVEQVVGMKWSWDFTDTFTTVNATFPAAAGGAEYGTAEFAVAQYAGKSAGMTEKKAGGKGTGEYVKVGFSTIINGGAVAAQQLNVYAKAGRLR
jgi:hypothetical protein